MMNLFLTLQSIESIQMWPLPILSCVRLKIEEILLGMIVWLKEEILGKSEKAIHHIENEGLYAPLSSRILIFHGTPTHPHFR